MVPAPKRGLVVRDLGAALRDSLEPLGEMVTLEMGKITLIAPRRSIVYRQKWLDAKPDYP